jgi:flagellar biosynthetic protein FliR
MLSQILPADTFALALVFARVGAAFMLLPGFGEVFVSPRVRLMLALSVTVVVTPVIGDKLPAAPDGPLAMFVLLGGEVAIGLFLGALTRMLLAALHMAGVVIGFQSSLANADLFDPINATQGSLFGAFLNILGVFLVFAADLHHLMLLAIADSYSVFAPAVLLPVADVAQMAISTLSRAFVIAMQIAAPFIVVGLMFYLGIGLLARLMPQVQVFFIAIPLQISISFLVTALTLSASMLWFLDYFEASLNLMLGQA